MPTFNYQVVTDSGDYVSGQLVADSLELANEKLERQYNMVIELNPAFELDFSILSALTEKPIKNQEKVQFFQNLKSLLDAGLPFDETLVAIQTIMDNRRLIRVIKDIHDNMQDGDSFSDCLSQYSELFPSSMVAMVKAGESTGQLSHVLGELADLLDWEFNMIKAIKKAVRYPIMVISAGIAAMLVIVTFVIPKFTSFFSSQDAELPLLTRILLQLNVFITGYWLVSLISIVSLIFIIRFLKNYPPTKQYIDPFILSLPLVGTILKKYMIARFTRFFALLYSSGIDVIKSLEISLNLFDNTVYQTEVLRLTSELKQGVRLSQAFETSSFFQKLDKQMVAIGEKSGELVPLMKKTSAFYSTELDYTMDNLFVYIEPFLVIFMGGMVLVLALGIFMPMWNMMQMM